MQRQSMPAASSLAAGRRRYSDSPDARLAQAAARWRPAARGVEAIAARMPEASSPRMVRTPCSGWPLPTLAAVSSRSTMINICARKHLDLATEYPQIVAAIEDFKPTILIGVSTVGKLFSREVVEAMSRINKRPIIFALSNPIEKHECLPEDAYAWSAGKVVYAGGVQFPPVHIGGQTFLPSQANNLYIFPAVGMAIYATNAKRVTDEMFIEAARAVADQVTPEQLKLGMLFPPQSDILEVEIQTATRVATVIFDADLARVERPANIRSWIEGQVYHPQY